MFGSRMMMPGRTVCSIVLALLSLICAGCANDILDPTQIGRFQPVPVVNVILDELGVADEADAAYAAAEPPRPEDLISYEQDYTFGPGDVVRISIYELQREGFPFVNDYIVTETGRISIPDVGQVRALGLTEKKLEDEIRDILSPAILKDPAVNVLLLESQRRVYSIYGWGVSRSGRYPIPRYDFRLTDAIAVAGDVGQFNVSDIYVTREVPAEEAEDRSLSAPPVRDLKTVEPTARPADAADEMLDLITPYAAAGTARAAVALPPATLVQANEPASVASSDDVPAGGPSGASESAAGGDAKIEWVFEQGRWKPVRIGEAPTAVSPPPREVRQPATSASPEIDWSSAAGARRTVSRVIRIPVDRLKGGDPRFDIVVRPGDRISVPGDVVGEFYIMGNVRSSGTITMTGRPMTLKMAIAAAGGLNEIAWPKKVEVVRRLARNSAGLMQEEIVMVDLDKIARGQQPDFFIKPHDLVNVGTHGASRWLAVLRNAFRATYGFGLIYDRNFATPDFDGDPFPGHIGPL